MTRCAIAVRRAGVRRSMRDMSRRPSTAAATVSGSTLTYTFPAHSLTILKVKIR